MLFVRGACDPPHIHLSLHFPFVSSITPSYYVPAGLEVESKDRGARKEGPREKAVAIHKGKNIPFKSALQKILPLK